MDGEGSRVPVVWDDRGEVAKAFDVGIFSDFYNLLGLSVQTEWTPGA